MILFFKWILSPTVCTKECNCGVWINHDYIIFINNFVIVLYNLCLLMYILYLQIIGHKYYPPTYWLLECLDMVVLDRQPKNLQPSNWGWTWIFYSKNQISYCSCSCTIVPHKLDRYQHNIKSHKKRLTLCRCCCCL